MGVRNSFDVLSDITEHYELQGGSVRNVEAKTSQTRGGVLQASLEVSLSLCSVSTAQVQTGLTPREATLTDEENIQVEFSPSDLLALPSTNGVTVVSEEAVTVTEDGDIAIEVDLTICPPGRDSQSRAVTEETDSEEEPSTGDPAVTTDAESAQELSPEVTEEATDSEGTTENEDTVPAQRDESVPPYEDTAYLEALYDSCDTFQEMSQEIEMEVSAETVRRYMIEAGVHEPETYETNQREETDDRETEKDVREQPPSTPENPLETIPDEELLTDGMGLPEDVSLTDIADAVVDSRSAHEVTKKLGLTEKETRKLLRHLNLLDLVLHRVGNLPRQEPSYHSVASRIRQCKPEEA